MCRIKLTDSCWKCQKVKLSAVISGHIPMIVVIMITTKCAMCHVYINRIPVIGLCGKNVPSVTCICSDITAHK